MLNLLFLLLLIPVGVIFLFLYWIRRYRTRQLEEPPVGKPKLINHKFDNKKIESNSIDEDAWPCKSGNSSRNGLSKRPGPRELSSPIWSFYTDAVCDSTTVIDGHGNIYIAPTSGMIYSLNPYGEIRWKFQVHGKFPSSPVLCNGFLYVSDTLGKVYALDTSTGKLKWERQPTPSSHGENWSLTALEGMLLVCSNGSVKQWNFRNSAIISLDLSSGQELWKYEMNNNGLYNVMPAVCEKSQSILFVDSQGGARNIQTKTGECVWKTNGYDWAQYFPGCFSSVTVVDNDIVYITGNHTVSKGSVCARNIQDGSILWEENFDQHMGNGACLGVIHGVKTLVFGVGFTASFHKFLPRSGAKRPHQGVVYGLNAENGERLWSFQTSLMDRDLCPGQKIRTLWPKENYPCSFSSPIMDSNGIVYIGWQGGIVYALDGSNGEMVSSYEAAEGMQAAPSIGPNGELVIATGDRKSVV